MAVLTPKHTCVHIMRTEINTHTHEEQQESVKIFNYWSAVTQGISIRRANRDAAAPQDSTFWVESHWRFISRPVTYIFHLPPKASIHRQEGIKFQLPDKRHKDERIPSNISYQRGRRGSGVHKKASAGLADLWNASARLKRASDRNFLCYFLSLGSSKPRKSTTFSQLDWKRLLQC